MSKTYYMQSPDGGVFTTTMPQYHKDSAQLTQAKGKELYKKQRRDTLRAMLKPGQTVYCVLRHVSRSGMSRRITFLIMQKGELWCIDSLIADCLDYKQSDSGGLIVSGCGMDMGFSVVYNLGAVLWPNGTKKPHSTRNGMPDSSGGYALRHSWV